MILADALGNSAPMLYLAVLGLRWGEVAGLRVADLDFLRGTVTVARQRTRGAKGRMVEQEPKTRAGRRTLSVPESIMKTLAEHLVKRGLSGRNPEALVFVSAEGEPLHYSNWRRRVWLPARDRAGLGDLTFHDLKHTAATLLVEEGIDIKTHRSASVTRTLKRPCAYMRKSPKLLIAQQQRRLASAFNGEDRRSDRRSPARPRNGSGRVHGRVL